MLLKVQLKLTLPELAVHKEVTGENTENAVCTEPETDSVLEQTASKNCDLVS